MNNEVITYLKSNLILIKLQFAQFFTPLILDLTKAHIAQRPTPFVQTLSSWLMNQVICLKLRRKQFLLKLYKGEQDSQIWMLDI